MYGLHDVLWLHLFYAKGYIHIYDLYYFKSCLDVIDNSVMINMDNIMYSVILFVVKLWCYVINIYQKITYYLTFTFRSDFLIDLIVLLWSLGYRQIYLVKVGIQNKIIGSIYILTFNTLTFYKFNFSCSHIDKFVKIYPFKSYIPNWRDK